MSVHIDGLFGGLFCVSSSSLARLCAPPDLEPPLFGAMPNCQKTVVTVSKKKRPTKKRAPNCGHATRARSGHCRTNCLRTDPRLRQDLCRPRRAQLAVCTLAHRGTRNACSCGPPGTNRLATLARGGLQQWPLIRLQPCSSGHSTTEPGDRAGRARPCAGARTPPAHLQQSLTRWVGHVPDVPTRGGQRRSTIRGEGKCPHRPVLGLGRPQNTRLACLRCVLASFVLQFWLDAALHRVALTFQPL